MTQLRNPGFTEAKPELIARLPSLLRELCPGGKQNGKYYMTKNPARADRKAGSFWVITKGKGAGVWKDEATGEGGDIIKLIGYVIGTRDNKLILQWSLNWLGWSGKKVDPVKAEARKKQIEANMKCLELEEAQALADNRKRAMAAWLNAEPIITGTVIEAYLKTRGIDLADLPKEPGALRFLPSVQHTDEDGVITNWPCMIAAMSGPDGKIGAIHRTWLAHDGSGKAPIVPARKIWPNYDGHVIRLAKGETNLSPEQAIKAGKAGPCVITEGVEDGLSVAIAAPQYRVWAAGTLGNIGKVPDLACISNYIICADNDWNKPQAEAQLANSAAALKRIGKPVGIVKSWIGKDVNDLIQGTTQ